MRARLAPRARREISAAVAWIAEENAAAARGLVAALDDVTRLIARHPRAGHERLELAGPPFRFMTIRGYPYLVAYNPDLNPPVIIRFVHTARDLPSVFQSGAS